jgi:hypothetical protein
MKKVLAIIIIFALSFGFLAFVDNMGGVRELHQQMRKKH